MTRVRVGIVSWNTAELLDRCLSALPAALADADTGARPLVAEVHVVDNASADASAQLARSHGAQVRVNPTNVGYATAMNQALADTDAAVLIALNPDTEPSPGSLATLVRRLLGAPGVGLVVPRLHHPDGSPQHSVYRFPSVGVAAAASLVPPRWQRGSLGRRLWLEGAADHDTSADIDWAIGAVHVIRAEALAGRAPYSQRWFMYVEDLELCWWLHRHGWRIRLEADVGVLHVGNAAGAQAWGDDRTRRWLAATYDWYELSHGAPARRRLAAINFLGASCHAAINAAGALAPLDGNARARRRVRARELIRALPAHLHALTGRNPGAGLP